MTSDAASAAARSELEHAGEELRAAEQLLQAKLVRVAATRVYYAVFHAARALVFSEGLEPRSHAGVHHLLNAHLVKSGRLEPSQARLFAKLQKYREEADYAEVYSEDEAGTRQDLADASAFVARATKMIASACNATSG
jgi:uncharacterized protein (UPF0332 family)